MIAKMDLVEVEGGMVTPVDYKHGRPREGAEGLELWPADRAQLAVQGIVLRENGYRCEEGVAYYRKTGQRVRVVFDEALIAETESLILQAWGTAEAGEIPAPLVDSPKCPGCSLVGICLPDETWRAAAEEARGTAATGSVRCTSAQVGEARSASDDDAAQRAASALSEQPGSEVGEERRGPPGEG